MWYLLPSLKPVGKGLNWMCGITIGRQNVQAENRRNRSCSPNLRVSIVYCWSGAVNKEGSPVISCSCIDAFVTSMTC
uniref:Uncharacterized protein n=1 Tax=Physcomitrium patens TaxID=3218 RepID=A0A2K1LBI8_PHYPA|nr:hypothetical protein PHYPA_001821 [Physcomitrium patens]